MHAERVAIYPGTFDPITNGHVDIISRALKIVDKLIIAIAMDTSKTPVFSLQERVDMVKKDMIPLQKKGYKVEVCGFEGLLVNFARENKAGIIIRGLRAVSDFEYEFQMSGMNLKMSPDIQTVFLPASESTHFIASSFLKEIARLGGDVSGMASKNVCNNLKKYYSKK